MAFGLYYVSNEIGENEPIKGVYYIECTEPGPIGDSPQFAQRRILVGNGRCFPEYFW
jgi:hypothetical protein